MGAEQKQGDWKTPCEAFPDQPGAGGSERCDVLVLLNRLFILLKLTPVSTENNPVKGWGWWGGGPATARISLGHGGGGPAPSYSQSGLWRRVGLTPSYNQPGLWGGPAPSYDQAGLWGSRYCTQLEPAWAMGQSGGSRPQLQPAWAMEGGIALS